MLSMALVHLNRGERQTCSIKVAQMVVQQYDVEISLLLYVAVLGFFVPYLDLLVTLLPTPPCIGISGQSNGVAETQQDLPNP